MWVQLTGFSGCSVFAARSNSSFFLLDEGALISPVAFVFVVNAAVGDFLFPAGVFFPTTTGIASIAPPSSVVLRPGVACFVTGDRVYGL